MTAPRSVARVLSPALVVFIALVLMTGGLGVAGVLVSTWSVQELTNEINPAILANERVLQDLTDAETGVRAWVLSNEESALDPYEMGVSRLAGHESALAEYAARDSGLAALVRQQEEASERWLSEYAEVRVARPGGPGTFDEELFALGTELFDGVRAINGQVEQVLQTRLEDQRESAANRLSATLIGIVLAALLAVLVAAQAARRLRHQIGGPLEALEGAAHLMRAKPDTRARVEGPREVQAVATALNELAAAQSRALAVEQRVQAELKSLDTAKGDFISNVSHELRTPLTTIAGYVELMSEELSDRLDERQRRMLDATTRNVNRLRDLIEDLLTLARAESASTDLEQLDVGELLGDVMDDLRMSAARRGVHISLQTPEEHVVVLADRPQLYRVFLNLVSNAVKFSLEGGLVNVAVSREGRDVMIVVADHGIGIPAADLDQLGTRFFRAANAISSQVPGTGLGLRVVQTILDHHAGSLVVDSIEGEGTTVTVRLGAQADLGAMIPTAPAAE